MKQSFVHKTSSCSCWGYASNFSPMEEQAGEVLQDFLNGSFFLVPSAVQYLQSSSTCWGGSKSWWLCWCYACGQKKDLHRFFSEWNLLGKVHEYTYIYTHTIYPFMFALQPTYFNMCLKLTWLSHYVSFAHCVNSQSSRDGRSCGTRGACLLQAYKNQHENQIMSQNHYFVNWSYNK